MVACTDLLSIFVTHRRELKLNQDRCGRSVLLCRRRIRTDGLICHVQIEESRSCNSALGNAG